MDRNQKLDAAKFILVFLVVLGHAIEQNRQIILFDWFYRVFYLFHMPAFIFLSGMVSANFLDGKRAKVMITAILLPLFVHQAGLQFLDSMLGNSPFVWEINKPNWVLWYLMSLFCWRLSMPFFSAVRYPLLIAIVASLVSGAASYVDRDWALARTLSFLPFFVAGHLWTDRRKAVELPSLGWVVGLIGLFAILVLGWFCIQLNVRWLYWYVGYAAMGVDVVTGMAHRLGLLLIGVLGVAAVLSLISALPVVRWVSRFGAYSVAPFILHAYVLKIAQYYGLRTWLYEQSLLVSIVAAVGGAAVVTIVCAWIGLHLPWLGNFSQFAWFHRART